MTDEIELIFVSLAQNQTAFFTALAKPFLRAGVGVSHICFHEPSVAAIREAGQTAYNVFDYQPEEIGDISFDAFDVKQAGLLIGHEKAAYEIDDTKRIETKFKGHLCAVDQILKASASHGKKRIMVQELGGFTSVLASYFVARSHDIDNYFIEPSFYKGRVFFTKNAFEAPVIDKTDGPVAKEVTSYLAHTLQSQTIVVPEKDKKHYRGAIAKITDSKNMRRLIEKMAAKYLRGQQEEFSHIGGHVKRHLRMFYNANRLKGHYSAVVPEGEFIYYPLHVPADFALTIRSPEYFDQYALIDYICRAAPLGKKVLIKEHPALVGAVDLGRMKQLLCRHDNLILMAPSINNHDILRAADAIVTVNSKSGAEALLYRKPVFVLGDAFYADSDVVCKIAHAKDLADVLAGATPPITDQAVEAFFNDVWHGCWSGELYETKESNIAIFADSLATVLDVPLTNK